MLETMMFVIGKLIFVPYQFLFRCFPHLDSRRPLDFEISLHTHTTYVKGILGLGEGGRVVKAEYAI